MNFGIRIALALSALAFIAIVFTSFERPPVDTVQRGFRGVGLVENYNPRVVADKVALNQVPAPEAPVDPVGQLSGEAYQNVQVLKDVDAGEFLRLMQAMTNWVAPQQGCTYCHNPENLADDSPYAKRVARRMIQMVRHINTDWQPHVGATGVTCYTCHRGQPVPANIWFKAPDGPAQAVGFAETRTGQNRAAPAAGLSSLPYDPFSPFLEGAENIRVVGQTPLPTGNRQSIKQTEWTYALMVHMSEALGVNCTYCHNSRSFTAWDQSAPQRATAWYGIRMARDLNTAYLEPLKAEYPHYRLGALGDAPKANCATCHQGVYKPLFGASMLKDYLELKGPAPQKQANAK